MSSAAAGSSSLGDAVSCSVQVPDTVRLGRLADNDRRSLVVTEAFLREWESDTVGDRDAVAPLGSRDLDGVAFVGVALNRADVIDRVRRLPDGVLVDAEGVTALQLWLRLPLACVRDSEAVSPVRVSVVDNEVDRVAGCAWSLDMVADPECVADADCERALRDGDLVNIKEIDGDNDGDVDAPELVGVGVGRERVRRVRDHVEEAVGEGLLVVEGVDDNEGDMDTFSSALTKVIV